VQPLGSSQHFMEPEGSLPSSNQKKIHYINSSHTSLLLRVFVCLPDYVRWVCVNTGIISGLNCGLGSQFISGKNTYEQLWQNLNSSDMAYDRFSGSEGFVHRSEF
jgi:hypothetical protein